MHEDRTIDSNVNVMSDVHALIPFSSIPLGDVMFSKTRFQFFLPKFLACEMSMVETETQAFLSKSETTHSKKMSENCCVDDDGDLVVMRPSLECCSDVELGVTIVHNVITDLSLVGQQVWLGALLMCDFLLHYHWLLNGTVVLDLGAGSGLTSIVAAMAAKTVFCTDYSSAVLHLAKVNVASNAVVLNGDIRVRLLDWLNFPSFDTLSGGLLCSADSSDSTIPFQFQQSDLSSFADVSIILSSEVVYDDDLTDAFFRLLYDLLKQQPSKLVFVTLEKRLVFTENERQVVSPAYEQFVSNLQDLCSVDEGDVRFLGSRVDLAFPQRFRYPRTDELELWKIESLFAGKSPRIHG